MTIQRAHIFSPTDLPDAPSQYAFSTGGRVPAGTSIEEMADAVEHMAARMRVPLTVDIDAVKADSLLGFKTPCVTAWHPNPPREYYKVLLEPQKARRKDEYAQVMFWFYGTSSTLDVMPGMRMKSMHSRIIDEASLKRPEDWTIVPELDYYQHVFDVLWRALSSLD